MRELDIFVNRLKKIGINITLISNFPLVYINTINNNIVREKFHSEHGFVLCYLPIRANQKLQYTNLSHTFNLIRLYRDYSVLIETFYAKLEKANELQLIRFCFEVNNEMYFSEWRKNKWLYPIKLNIL